MDYDLNNQHSYKSQYIPDFINIILYPSHQLSGIGIIKVIHGKALNVVK